jgi:hypothetical protein
MCLPFCNVQPDSPSCSTLNAGSTPLPAGGAGDVSTHRGHAASPVHHSTQQQEAEGQFAGAGACSSLSPTTVQAMSRVAALGGTAVRPQSVSRRMQPAAYVHRLEVGTACRLHDMAGFDDTLAWICYLSTEISSTTAPMMPANGCYRTKQASSVYCLCLLGNWHTAW